MGAQLGDSEILLEALSHRTAAHHSMTGTLGASAAAKRSPEHRIDISPTGKTWVAMLGDLELARSDRALLLTEASLSPVVYFPPDDVRTGTLSASETTTHCPFKGDASYWASEVDGERVDIAWFYPRTFDGVSEIAGYVAFYADRVTVRPADM